MIEVLSLLVIFILLILGIIWGHFIFANKNKDQDETFTSQRRENTNVDLYHEHKAEIEKDFADGAIDDESYKYLLAELDKSLLQDIDQSNTSAADLSQDRPLGLMWPVMLSIFVLVFSIVFYNQHGALEQLSQSPPTPADSEQMQVHQQMEALIKQTTENPQNAEAWYALGQAYVGLGRFDSAIEAFDTVISIEGEHADLYGAKAQAMYYRADQHITPEVQSFIDKALSIDPNDPSTNILLGMHNFMAQEYQQAIDYWTVVINSGRSTVNVEALREAISEAKNRLTASGEQVANNTEVAGPQLSVDVSLSDSIIEKLSQSEDKVVFIYAVPAQGARMPVAAVKMMASDLPAKVVLSDATAMSPQAKLSDVSVVHVYAVVSKLGGAGIKSGDFKAEQTNINVTTTQDIELVIDEVVP
ncbi:c-type cytochrome biogenesis protein CcmI [Thalassotalea atypica]|uniref:c-type cytochrome biogenesis protein CcmI n=1 Tax=Thalassotalea atypica TaxID=2054316 RepID=UPI002572C098|nr:c-type cytochrome biogenesis protein CcmI [Thalassotalea atypica]